MKTVEDKVERLTFLSKKPFDQVLAELEKGISRPDMNVLHRQLRRPGKSLG